ncbi:uncharacterized protein C8Q71DRAFT_504127 [Rhodofomes roseus]|uniref:Uncharacterized protein n=1 Tax=Rhodofomes roseus TaxID=34475 RepID=A0ABQ8KLP7_9APHY|nr:uncharacterized protein C8Q71DRAFT_504127 [Rhodofomes roseus]KAH9839249.1 hypothetical protein C8Q71DRAFT_504127 [Rhodofomes roseus]
MSPVYDFFLVMWLTRLGLLHLSPRLGLHLDPRLFPPSICPRLVSLPRFSSRHLSLLLGPYRATSTCALHHVANTSPRSTYAQDSRNYHSGPSPHHSPLEPMTQNHLALSFPSSYAPGPPFASTASLIHPCVDTPVWRPSRSSLISLARFRLTFTCHLANASSRLVSPRALPDSSCAIPCSSHHSCPRSSLSSPVASRSAFTVISLRFAPPSPHAFIVTRSIPQRLPACIILSSSAFPLPSPLCVPRRVLPRQSSSPSALLSQPPSHRQVAFGSRLLPAHWTSSQLTHDVHQSPHPFSRNGLVSASSARCVDLSAVSVPLPAPIVDNRLVLPRSPVSWSSNSEQPLLPVRFVSCLPRVLSSDVSSCPGPTVAYCTISSLLRTGTALQHRTRCCSAVSALARSPVSVSISQRT